MKNNIYIIFILFSTFSCSEKVEKERVENTFNPNKTPIENVWQHVKFQNDKGFENVVEDYKKILDSNPNSAEANFLYLRLMDDKIKKYKKLNSALEKFPENPYLMTELGKELMLTYNEYNKSSAYLYKSLELDKNNPMTYHVLSIYCEIKKNKKCQLEHLQSLSNLSFYYLYTRWVKLNYLSFNVV